MSGSRRNREEEAASFDSLLDTMTNVVGILVIVLVITQLGVQKAVKRIEENLPAVTPEQLEAARRAAAEPAADPEKLARERAALMPPTEAELEALRKQLEALRKRLAVDPALRAEIERLQASLAQKEKQQAEAARKETEESRRKSDLEAKLAQTALRQAPPAVYIPMPAPRPAPKGSEAITVLCRHNRVIPVDAEDLRDYVVGRMRAMRSLLLAPGAPAGEQGRTEEDPMLCDPAKVKAFFSRQTIGTRELDLGANIIPEKRVRNLVVSPKPAAGESAAQARLPTSRFHLLVRQLVGKPLHIRFLVWPDSFEAYIEARKICDRLNVPAGWDIASSSTWEVAMDPRIKIQGEAPPPKPAPPVPGAPPPRPRNVLD